MTTVVTGVLSDVEAAEQAVGRLEAGGFARATISVILRSTPEQERLVQEETDDTPRGALAGALFGGAFASLTFGVLALSGVGVLAIGPLLSALAGGGAGAAAGGLLGALTGKGVSTQLAQEYETAIRAGHALVAVHTVHGHARAAHAALVAAGAQNVSENVHFARREHGSA
jgi:hypothetical protein